MRRFVVVLSLLTVVTMGVMAQRGLNPWKILTLADGTTVKAQLRGDAFLHFWQDQEGNRYTYDETLRPLTHAEMQEMRGQRVQQQRPLHTGDIRRSPKRIPIGADHEPLKGTHRELIILVNFSDVAFQGNHNQAFYNGVANERNYANMSEGLYGSVRDYFESQSDGEFTMNFDVVGPITLPHSQGYYGGNSSATQRDSIMGRMTLHAVQAVADQLQWKDYDNDGDGYVDQVFVLYAGTNEAQYGGEDAVWPHKYNLSYTKENNYQPLTMPDGTKMDDYACTSELTCYGFDDYGQTVFDVAGIGTLCHEFSHCLGLPDVYDTSYGGNYGMNTWSIMDEGQNNGINGPGLNPPAYTAYERMYCGWRQPVELTEDVQVRGMKPISEGGNTYIIYNKANRNEYYLLENRQIVYQGQDTQWDKALEGYGLLVTHVDFDPQVWAENEVNSTDPTYNYSNNDHQRLHVLAADNSYQTWKIDTEMQLQYYDYSDVHGDCYPYGKLDSLSNMSMPRATLYNPNTDGRKLLNVGLTNIKRNSDGTIDFDFRAVAGDDGSTPGDEVYLKETFDQCDGKGGNDNLWSGSIANSQLVTDVPGWTATNSKNGANQCAKFGGSRAASVVTSPEFAINGTVVVSFKAAAWGGDPTDLTLTVYCKDDDASNFQLEQTTFTMKDDDWTEFTTTLTGYGKLQLRFTPRLRFFLDEVEVRGTGDLTSIKGLSDDNVSATRKGMYDLTGRKVEKVLKEGVYIVDGKKVRIGKGKKL